LKPVPGSERAEKEHGRTAPALSAGEQQRVRRSVLLKIGSDAYQIVPVDGIESIFQDYYDNGDKQIMENTK
jgi:hypothetical protein